MFVGDPFPGPLKTLRNILFQHAGVLIYVDDATIYSNEIIAVSVVVSL